LVFGKRAGEYAAAYAKKHGAAAVDEAQVDAVAHKTLEPFERAGSGTENAFIVQSALQDMMQDLVGIVRTDAEMRKAAEGLRGLRKRAEKVRVEGNREFNPGWHTALDLENLLCVAEAITISALERQESRGAHFREDFPAKSDAWSTFNHVIEQAADGSMKLARSPLLPITEAQKRIIAEMV
jgi:succinate dehydrogenase / fumarate reductase flavoprotein subunit